MQGFFEEIVVTLKETIIHYWIFVKTPYHSFSNLIDPRYIGKHMGTAERDDLIENFYEEYPEAAEALDDFSAFCRTKEKSASFKGLGSGKTEVLV